MRLKLPFAAIAVAIVLAGAVGYGLVMAHGANSANGNGSSGPFALGGCPTVVPAVASSNPPALLRITRPADPSRQMQPLDRCVTDAATVQRLYNAALALRVVPPNAVFHCPMDDGIVYHLIFWDKNGGALEGAMDLDASGCRFLKMGDTVRFTDDAFNALVAKAAGIPTLDPPFSGA